MPGFMVGLSVFLASIVTALVARVLFALGLGVVTYIGVSNATSELSAKIITEFGGLPADTLTMVALLGIDKAITIILSAYVIAWTLRGMKEGVKRVMPFGG